MMMLMVMMMVKELMAVLFVTGVTKSIRKKQLDQNNDSDLVCCESRL